jgi:hypothetical protein
MVVDREVADKEMAAKGTLPIKGVMRTGGLTTIRGVAIALMVRVILVMMGEIIETDPSWHHAPPGVIPMTW